MKSNYLEVVGPDDECAKHGKEHMVFVKDMRQTLDLGDGVTLSINKGTWVCQACTGVVTLTSCYGKE
jgi:H2-forming N5,N10-methylenetetrahydromethanopterin dehydrogenase-like enzyme